MADVADADEPGDLRLTLRRHRFLPEGGRAVDPWPLTREQLSELVERLLEV